MSLRRSRGIPAARPTERHLRSACTQVAICGVWSIAHKDQKRMLTHSLNLASTPCSSPVCRRWRFHGRHRRQAGLLPKKRESLMLLLWPLIFMHARSDTTNRDLGAGRTQAMRSGQRDMDVALAAPRHGWRMAACPRSIAGAEGTRRRRAKPGAKTLGYLVSFQVTRRRRNSSAVRTNQQHHPNTRSALHPPHKPMTSSCQLPVCKPLHPCAALTGQLKACKTFGDL